MATTSGTTGTSAAASYGLDVSSIVSQLVAADRKGPDALIASRKSDATTQISGLAAVKSALSVFQTAISKLKGTGALSTRATTTSNDKIVTATATGSAATGAYNVEVLALAKSQQLASTAFAAGPTTVVGTGTLTIGQGTGSFSVTIDSTNNTLTGIRNAINSASGNTGVQATLIQETNGTHLVFSATKTGAAGAMTVSQTGGDGGLAQITSLVQKQPAQDSHIRVAGFDHYSATNTVSDSIDGVTLNLVSASVGDIVSVGITLDTNDVKKQVQSFVSAYNSLQGTLSQLDSYDSSTKTAGAMFGDSLLRGVEDQLRQDLSKSVSGLPAGFSSLATIGVTKQVDGTLALDEGKLNTAVAQNPGAVSSLFGGDDGVATTLFKHLDTMLLSTGSIASRNQNLQETLSKIQDDTDALDARMDTLQKQYVKQFTALDSLLASLQTTSNFLTTALAGLPEPNLTSK